MRPRARQSGRTALVTGVGGGIGRATALRLAREGGLAVAAPADVRVCDQVEAAVAIGLERFGSLHVLVSNAGVFGESVPFLEVRDETWDRVMGVNVQGTYGGLTLT